uniref:Uncharacterized protein n=1 Tax=Glossina brevipalpis TaxID=37001 RepID=A0A1A9WGX8_9MUSC
MRTHIELQRVTYGHIINYLITEIGVHDRKYFKLNKQEIHPTHQISPIHHLKSSGRGRKVTTIHFAFFWGGFFGKRIECAAIPAQIREPTKAVNTPSHIRAEPSRNSSQCSKLQNFAGTLIQMMFSAKPGCNNSHSFRFITSAFLSTIIVLLLILLPPITTHI